MAFRGLTRILIPMRNISFQDVIKCDTFGQTKWMYCTQTKKEWKDSPTTSNKESGEPHVDTARLRNAFLYYASVYLVKNPSLGSDVLAAAAKSWNAMTEEQKYPWQQKHNEHLASYAEFQNTDEYKRIQKIEEEMAELLVDQPKLQNPYVVYCTQGREFYTPKMGERWKNMTLAEKEPFRKQSLQLAEEFEMWKKRIAEDGRLKKIEALETKLKATLKDLTYDKPKNPRGAVNYFVWKGDHKGKNIKEICEEWKMLSDAERKPYEDIRKERCKELDDWKEKMKNTPRYKEIQSVRSVLRRLYGITPKEYQRSKKRLELEN